MCRHRIGEGGEAVEQKLEMQGGGELTVQRDGLRVYLTAVRPNDNRGLYKVWLRGNGGGKVLLGTLVPEKDVLTLNRTLSLRELAQAGCWPQLRAECSLTFPFGETSERKWYCEQKPGGLFSDPLLKRWVCEPILCRRDKRGFSLAAPFRTDRRMPLPGLFCFGRIERWPAGLYIVWKFNKQGIPVLLSENGK